MSHWAWFELLKPMPIPSDPFPLKKKPHPIVPPPMTKHSNIWEREAILFQLPQAESMIAVAAWLPLLTLKLFLCDPC